jgi:ribonuclease G
MAKEICISSTPHETRLAILEDDQLAEIYYERENEYTLAGSIYNGRVTRVLPGMQSAFVDLGLERDAFLYVTDFVELEDQEDNDEIEKAAATGATQPPREVRHTNGQEQGRSGRQDDRGSRSGQKPQQGPGPGQVPGQGQDTRQERQPRDRQPAEGSAAETAANAPSTPEYPAVPEHEEGSEEAGGNRRWRGRRHRRGSRGTGSTSEPGEAAGESSETSRKPDAEPEKAEEIQAAEAHFTPQPHRSQKAPEPFVLPGESLSKYGGAPADETPKSAPEAPAGPRPTFKPSTLVEAPLQWDGSGLLPGESISRRRTQREEPAEEAGEPAAGESEAGDEESAESTAGAEPDETQHAELEHEEAGNEEHGTEKQGATVEESTPPSWREIEAAPREHSVEFAEDQLAPDSVESRSEEDPVDDDELYEEETLRAAEQEEPAAETEADGSASHRIDPASPTGFRLFGLGGKKKKEEEPAAPAPAPSAPAVSAYAPGAGHIEEEVIEGEEFEAAPHHRRHKTEEPDLDDYEEETLPPQIRSGDLGEMLQEAHLDHRIQLNLDEQNGDDEEGIDGEDEEEEEPAAGTQPAGGQPRRDRNARGSRGRPGKPVQGAGNRRGPSRRSMQTSDLPIISDLLKSGQEILVQIAKEPIAKKGARITSHIALPGRFLVFMPTVTHVGVSRKIASDEERHRLKRILVHERGEATGGFIVRTAAEGASEDELRADLRFLMNLWNDIKQRSDSSNSPALIYHDLSLIERILRDQVSSNFSNIWVDSEADYERIVKFLNRFSPSLVRRVKLYTKETPLFEHFGIQDEISKALRSKVWLKSGGSIVINQTEALVAIDINTGKYVGKSARLEDTIVKTNLDAVPEIVRQIRLRDLGGIIVIDFIDMDERKNRFKVLAALEEALKADRAPTKVLQFNDFGLVAITRKRVKQSLERTLSVPCPTCQATGMVKSSTTVCNEIYTELRKMKKHFEGADVLLRVNPETVKVLKQNNASWLTEFEELVGKNILVKSDATLHPEQFDIQG